MLTYLDVLAIVWNTFFLIEMVLHRADIMLDIKLDGVVSSCLDDVRDAVGPFEHL